jgi:rubrerythrin
VKPSDWIETVRSGNIPPHDGRRCPECGYPLTEEHASDQHPGWLLCPVCDTYDTGEAA